MFARVLSLAALLAVTATGAASAADMPVKALKPVAPAPFFFVNENSIGYSYYFTATDPGVSKTAKNVLNFTHFDVWAYGTNFFTVDWLKSDTRDPVGGTAGSQGATEIYGLFRSTIGFNQLFNTRAFTVGPLTNVSFIVGADLNTENNALQPAKRSMVAGLNFDFALLYKGTFSLAVEAYKEYSHNAFYVMNGGDTDFRTTWRLEGMYTQPLDAIVPLPLTFSTLYGIQGPKGAGNPSANAFATKTEYFVSPKLALDVGKVVGYRPGMTSVYGAYRYWKNKFGIDPTAGTGTCCTVESSWVLGVTQAF